MCGPMIRDLERNMDTYMFEFDATDTVTVFLRDSSAGSKVKKSCQQRVSRVAGGRRPGETSRDGKPEAYSHPVPADMGVCCAPRGSPSANAVN